MLMQSMFREVLAGIPDYQVFFTVDELNARLEDVSKGHRDVKKIVLGHSRRGSPIYALEIGHGPRTGFIFGAPHPNEPIGTMMLDFFVTKLVKDRAFREWTGLRWVIIPCADPDGMRLNEGWFKGPFTPLNYARNFYRPPHFEQVEWTFPVDYKTLHFDSPLPETKALMRVIEVERPIFMYSLHNAGFGGAYYYVSQRCEEVYADLREAAQAQSIPLSLGEPEMPYARGLSDAVYLMPSIYDQYEYIAQFSGRDPAEIIKGGAGSTDYARRFVPHIFSLVTEVPYFYDPRIEDTSETSVSRREAVLEGIALQRAMYNDIATAYKGLVIQEDFSSPFLTAIAEYIRRTPSYLAAKEKWALTTPEVDRPATVAEVFDNLVVTRFYGMLVYGMLLRLCAELLSVGTGLASSAARFIQDNVEQALLRHDQSLTKDLNYEVIPIQRLVAVQLVAGLCVVNWLNKGR